MKKGINIGREIRNTLCFGDDIIESDEELEELFKELDLRLQNIYIT